MNVKEQILKILQGCGRDAEFVNGTIHHILDKDKASDQLTVWIEMYDAARCAELLVNLSNEIAPKRQVTNFKTGGVASAPAVFGDDERPEHVLTDEQLERIKGKIDNPQPVLRTFKNLGADLPNQEKNEG